MDELVGYSVKTFSPGSIGDSLKIGKHKFLILLISQNIKYGILNTPMTVRFFDLTANFTLSDLRPVMAKQRNFWSRICFVFQFL